MDALDRFNSADDGYARAVLDACVRVPAWAEALLDARPYATLDDLLATAGLQAQGWSDAEVEAALADHPRIGETPTAVSRAEQGSVDATDRGLLERLADGNRRYEQRFARIYLVRASGRTGEDLLDLLSERLQNTPEVERAVVRDQLAEITLLRLTHALTVGASA